MSRRTEPFPWAEAMAFAYGVLHLAPEAFWTMTPRELAAAIRGAGGGAAAPLGKADLDRLMQMFPGPEGPIHDNPEE